jgi:hypothetical protein
MKNGWDEYTPTAKPSSAKWATTARGWYFRDGAAVGNYRDYGPLDYRRSPHEFCHVNRCICELSQPGKIHCVTNTPDGHVIAWRWVETVEQAKQWIEEQTAAHEKQREQATA